MSILDLIFPKTCLGCRKEGKYICDNCLVKVQFLKSVCPYCEKASIDGFTHIKCQMKFGLDGLTSVWSYEDIVKKAIQALKYKYSTEVGKELVSHLVTWLINNKELIPNNHLLVPIPIHWHRENVRGFNQSIEIGKSIALAMNCKFIPDLLIKKQPTTPQAGLSVEKRKQNLQGVFAVSPNISVSLYPSILLFDDVFTTGSTLREAAKVLKRAGVVKVWGLTIAR